MKTLKKVDFVNAEILKQIIEHTSETEIKVNQFDSWDHFTDISKVQTRLINQGNGYEPALFVSGVYGTFIYTPPFKLEALPTDTSMLLFYAGENSFYVHDFINFKDN